MIEEYGDRSGSCLMGFGALMVASAIAAGAFGAHALKGSLTVTDLEVFQTAAQYHLIQGLAVTFWGFVVRSFGSSNNRQIARAAVLLIVSTAIFCLTLYTLVLFNVRWLGAVTPIGGAGMMVSWVWLAWLSFRRR